MQFLESSSGEIMQESSIFNVDVPKLVQCDCCVASKIFNEGISTDYLNNVRAVNGIVNENIFN